MMRPSLLPACTAYRLQSIGSQIHEGSLKASAFPGKLVSQMPTPIGMLSYVTIYLLRSQNKKQLTLILCLIYINNAVDTISQNIFYELEYFLTAGTLGDSNPSGLGFVILILSTLTLCIYPDDVITVNMT